MLPTLRALTVTTLCLTALSSPVLGAGLFGGDAFKVDPVEGTIVTTAQIARVDRKVCPVEATASENLVKLDVAAGELTIRAGKTEKPRQAGHVISLEFRAVDSGATYVVDLKLFDAMKRKETLRVAAGKDLAKMVAARFDGVALPLDRIEAGGDLQAVRPQGGEPVELYCRVGALGEAPQSPTDDRRAAAFPALYEER